MFLIAAVLGMLVAGFDVPVYPARIDGAFECWPATQRRPRFGKVTVAVGDPLSFADEPNRRRGWEKVATELADAVRELGPRPRARPGVESRKW